MARRKIKNFGTRRLFKDPSGQQHLFEKSLECLGTTFENDEERREMVGRLVQQVFNEAKRSGGKFPALIVVEEAHNYAPDRKGNEGEDRFKIKMGHGFLPRLSNEILSSLSC